MKLALEALKELVAQTDGSLFAVKHDHVALQNARQAITALREALAKPDFWEGYVPEPVKPAQCAPAEDGVCEALDCSNHKPAQQEPVAWMSPHGGFLSANYINNFASGLDKEIHNIPLYTSPPAQRTWVGLTDEDKQIAFDDTQEGGGFWEFADAIEAKLKEKNT